MTTAQIEARIAELKATPRALIGSDEGTHTEPVCYSIYMEIDGKTYAVKKNGGATINVYSVEHAEENTAGKIRHFSNEASKMRAAQQELRQLQKVAN